MTVAKDLPRVCGVYQILNVVDGCSYIGSSVHALNRMAVHKRCLKGERHHNARLQRAWNRLGTDSFTFVVVERCDEKNLVEAEQRWIDKVDPQYNLTLTARRIEITSEARANISASLKGRKLSAEHVVKTSDAMKRRMLCPEFRAKVLAANVGRKLSDEHRAKLSVAKLGKENSFEHRRNISKAKLGCFVSLETRAKISATLKAKGIRPPLRRVAA